MTTSTLIHDSSIINSIARAIRNHAFDSINSRNELRAMIASFIDSRDYARCDDELIIDAIHAFMIANRDELIARDAIDRDAMMQFMMRFNRAYSIAYAIGMMIAH